MRIAVFGLGISLGLSTFTTAAGSQVVFDGRTPALSVGHSCEILRDEQASMTWKEAMVSKPEGVDSHGAERVGPIHGLNPEDRTYLNFDKVETLGSSSEIPVLVLPVGKRIEFQLAAADVVHGFWVPEFLFKRDVLPNPVQNNSDNVFQVSEINQTGAFVGRCTEMCGTYHSMMNFELRVVEPNDFKAYLDQRTAGKTNAEALEAINQPPLAITTEPFDTRRGEQAPQIPQASR